MKTLGNILWIIFVGFWSAIGWFLGGILCCITIIGIPFGKQCFKIARLMFAPFGKTIVTDFGSHPVANVLWIIFCGWELAVGFLVAGLIWFITIIGIPFGKQCFKLTSLSLIPFGAKVKN